MEDLNQYALDQWCPPCRLLSITHGVPQGAILSPLLFCMYMNDLPSITLNCHLESYVDDSKPLMSFPMKNIETASNKRVAKLCSGNQLLINPAKTKFLLVGTRQMIQGLPDDMELSFPGNQVKPVASGKDLDLIVDSHLTQLRQPHKCHCVLMYEQTLSTKPREG